MKTRESAGTPPETMTVFRRIVLGTLVLILLVSCASRDEVRSGASAVYSTGLSVTLLSWKYGEPLYAGKPPRGRWFIAEIRVDYDGNAPHAEIPTSALKVAWEGPDGSSGEAAPVWVYDPTPGVGGSAKRAALRVRVTNRFTLAFDLPENAAPSSFLVGATTLPLSLPAP